VNDLATDGHAYGHDRASVSTLRPQRRNRSGPGIVVGRCGGAAGGAKKSSSRRPSSLNWWIDSLPWRRERVSPARCSFLKCREATDRSIPVSSARSVTVACFEARSTKARLSRFGSARPAAIRATFTACWRFGTAASAARSWSRSWMTVLCWVLTFPGYRPDPCTSVHATPGRPRIRALFLV
jgi:hypothetical protein